MRFPYFKLPLGGHFPFFGHSILKPIIPVKIGVGSNEIQYAALIDSGADFCIFEGEIGEILGLDVRRGTPAIFGGVGEHGPLTAFLHEVKIGVGGAEHQTTVGFSYDLASHGYGLLGQKGFF